METVNKLSPKENFGTFCHKRAKGAGDEGSKQKLLTIDQFNKCSFCFEQIRSIECVKRNGFKTSIMS